ncbi:MAG: hypothetical protein H0U35_00585 [Sporichthyaceae bacterium]|nr:hypothetical protein [Sporichthyaceae bacterium]
MAVWAVHEPTTSGLLNLVDAGSIENDDDLTSWSGRGTDGRVHVVALGRPGPGRVELSTQLTVKAGGRLVRRWRAEDIDDGVLVTSLGAGAGPIVLVRRIGARAVASDVAYVSPRAHLADPRVAGLVESSYRGPDPVIVRRLVAAAVRHVLPSHQAHGQVVWSGAASSDQAAALVRVRLGSGSGLHLLVEEAGAAATTAKHHSLTAAVAAQLSQSGPAMTSSIVITLTNGRSRRVPRLHRSGSVDMDSMALAGSAFTLTDPTGRVTAMDAPAGRGEIAHNFGKSVTPEPGSAVGMRGRLRTE